MIELPVLIENIIEIVNVAIEMMLVFLYFSLLSKAKVNKAVLYLSYLLSTVILHFFKPLINLKELRQIFINAFRI